MKPGTVGINSGPMMAAADRFTIEITRQAAAMERMPYQTVDVVLVAAHIITAAQSIVSRNVRAHRPAPCSACVPMQAGDLGAFSVLPGSRPPWWAPCAPSDAAGAGDGGKAPARSCATPLRMGFGATAHRALRAYLPRHHQHLRTRPVFAGDVAERLAGPLITWTARPGAQHGR